MDDRKKIPENDPATEEEIRRGRKFSLAEAVGREAAGALKGASPVAATRQLLLEIDHLLQTHLPDSEGSLRRTIMARLEDNPPLLGRHLQAPAAALNEFVADILDTPTALDQLVRQADARWGRDFDEKPLFDRPGQAEHPDDPYTRTSVQAALQALARALA
jgi:hypothetical protein